MSDNSDSHREQQPPFLDDSLLINTRPREVERQQTEEKEYQREYNNKQLRFNALLSLFTALLFVATAISDVLMFRYVAVTGKSADAAASAANTANAALEQTKKGATDTHDLAVAAKAQADSTGNIAERALSQTTATNKLAAAANLSADIGQKSLDANIEVYQVDQRPWVGLADFATIAGTETEDRKGFSYKGVQIAIRNSGKTPAINLSAVTLQMTLPWREKPGDYDSFTAEFKRKREEVSAQLLEEQIRRTPQMADRLRAWDREFREREAQSENELFPAGQVLAPGIAITQTTAGINYGNLRGSPERPEPPATVYVLGKITYNDIFKGTPLHTTKFCLMRQMGTQFVACPSGNFMD